VFRAFDLFFFLNFTQSLIENLSNVHSFSFVLLLFVLELFKYDVVTHCYLGGLIGLSVAIYAWQRFS